MPEPIEELYVEIGADIAPLLKDTNKGIDDVEKDLKKLEKTGTSTFNKIGKVAKSAAGVITAIGAAIGAVIVAVNKLTRAAVENEKAFSNLAISANAANREFGDAVGTAKSWEDTVKRLAKETKIYSERDLANASVRLVDMSKRLGLTEQQMETLLMRTIDLSAGKVDLEGGIERVTAAMRGEAESAEFLGLSLNENTVKAYAEAQGLVWKNLSDVEKAQQRYNLFLSQTNELQGRGAKFAETLAGKEAELNATLENRSAILGEQLMPLQEGYVAGLILLTEESEGSASIITNAFARIAAGAITMVKTLEGAVATATALFKVWSAGSFAIANLENPLEAMQQAVNDNNNELKLLGNTLWSIPDIASNSFNQIKEGWEEQRDAAKQASEEAGVGFLPPPEEIDKQSDEITNLIRDIGLEMIDLQEQTNADLEADQQEHADTMAAIEEDGAKERLEINKKYDEELTKSQQEILDDARDDLAKLEEETDKDLERRRKDTNKEELRETEDHLTDMRRLRLGFLDNLEDAVKDRDAGRVRDLQRQFARESQERQQDFEKKRSREQSDTQDELAEIRNREEERAREIIERRTQALADVEQRIAESRARDLTALDEKLAAERERENTRFTERQTELENALNMRLETLAKELSDMEELESESAQRILETLNEYFGAGGNIDQLMNDFEARRKKTLTLEIGFEESTGPSKSSRREGAGSRGRGRGGSIPSFATGGTLLATSPTLAQFGEVPELVQFTPLSKMGNMGGGNQSMQIDLKLSGSAPPGIRSGDRDAIAMVMVNALREAGINTKPGR